MCSIPDCYMAQEFRLKVVREGSDVIHMMCLFCGDFAFESDGIRIAAWFRDKTNPCGYRYAYDDPHNNDTIGWVWKDDNSSQE